VGAGRQASGRSRAKDMGVRVGAGRQASFREWWLLCTLTEGDDRSHAQLGCSRAREGHSRWPAAWPQRHKASPAAHAEGAGCHVAVLFLGVCRETGEVSVCSCLCMSRYAVSSVSFSLLFIVGPTSSTSSRNLGRLTLATDACEDLFPLQDRGFTTQHCSLLHQHISNDHSRLRMSSSGNLTLATLPCLSRTTIHTAMASYSSRHVLMMS
jgi:hypothetical protein